MPRAWREHWPLAGEQTEPAAQALQETERDAAKDRLGNLTLVSATFNQSVSNGAWAAKRPELAAQSSLQLNSWIAAQPEWTETTISTRADELALVAARIWPSAEALRAQLKADA